MPARQAPVDVSRAAAASELLRSRGARQGLVLGAAMIVAGGLDYAVSVVAGRWLAPEEFGVFVAVTALLQVLLSVATAIRMVVAFYTSDLDARADTAALVGPFLRRTAAWSVRWGLVAAGCAVLATPALGAAFQVARPGAFWAAAAMVLMLFVREPALGALQGTQAFGVLGAVQVSQAAVRLALAAALVLAGAQAAGAVLAQALAAAIAVAVALPRLRPALGAGAGLASPAVSRSYALLTVVGLALFGVLTNADALFVKMAYSPRLAGDYGAVVTLEKMSLFLPWSISFVLFPKATQRLATGKDPRPLLLAALAAVLAPGLLLSAAYLAAPGAIVRAVFAGAYADPGPVLGLVSLAATLHAGANIWLNYALSTGRTRYVRVLLAAVVVQAAALVVFGRTSLLGVALAMVAAGVLANVGGFLTAWSPADTREGAVVRAVPAGAGTRRRRPSVTGVLAAGGAAVAAGYVVLLATLHGLPYQDLPNHLARATISADLLFDAGRRFGDAFSVRPGLAPYVLHDLAFAWLVHALGPYAAGCALMILSFLATPVAVAVLLRAWRCSRSEVILGCVVSLYLSSDFTFVTGFTSYRLGFATALLALAAWSTFLESGSRRAYLGYAVAVAVGYLTHLSATFFTAFCVAATAVLAVRRAPGALVVPVTLLRRALAGVLPLVATVAWHVSRDGVAPAGPTEWPTLVRKATGAFLPFHRYDLASEGVLFAAFVGVLALVVLHREPGRLRRAVTPAVLAGTCFALYAVLPFSRGYLAYLDLRALPFAWLFVAIAAIRAGDRARPRWGAALLALALAAANLGQLAHHLLRHDAVMRGYREIAAQVPAGATFAPVATRPRDGTTNPYLHAGSFATIERGARSPYLFIGGVTSHFQARRIVTAPTEFWYQQEWWDRTAGARLVEAFPLLLVMKPFDPARLPAATGVLAENEVATLLEVQGETTPAPPSASASRARR
jgi:O-antigen/teichoic acid export membrane protein